MCILRQTMVQCNILFSYPTKFNIIITGNIIKSINTWKIAFGANMIVVHSSMFFSNFWQLLFEPSDSDKTFLATFNKMFKSFNSIFFIAKC